MTREEAREFLINISYKLGDMSVEYLSDKDGEKMREAIKVLEHEPCEDAISREAAIKYLNTNMAWYDEDGEIADSEEKIKAITDLANGVPPFIDRISKEVEAMSSVTPKRKTGKWIPVSEKLPEDLEPVNITWVNHEPEPYYHEIKDKNFVATGIHYRDKWYWYSTTCADYLGEYGSNEIDLIDDAVEIVAWMPLPEPYKAESEELMQIVINIDEEIYKARQHLVANQNRMIDEVDIAIANGIQLPKGHGRLIDADELQDYFEDNRSKLFHSKDCIIGIDKALTIIEADRSEEI